MIELVSTHPFRQGIKKERSRLSLRGARYSLCILIGPTKWQATSREARECRVPLTETISILCFAIYKSIIKLYCCMHLFISEVLGMSLAIPTAYSCTGPCQSLPDRYTLPRPNRYPSHLPIKNPSNRYNDQ